VRDAGSVSALEPGRIDFAACVDVAREILENWWDRVRIYPRFLAIPELSEAENPE
jgi:hypothetical protein